LVDHWRNVKETEWKDNRTRKSCTMEKKTSGTHGYLVIARQMNIKKTLTWARK